MTWNRRTLHITLGLVASAAFIVACGTTVAQDAPGRLDTGTSAAEPVSRSPGSADILALLPDGEQKRSFILDCTGCHQMDAQRTFAAGRVRSAQEWEAAIHRMLQMAGPSSSFPVISARVDPAVLAQWLASNIRGAPNAAPRAASAKE